jgi:hypothetical protein
MVGITIAGEHVYPQCGQSHGSNGRHCSSATKQSNEQQFPLMHRFHAIDLWSLMIAPRQVSSSWSFLMSQEQAR